MLVDEYQDTNPAQYRLFRASASATATPFTAVGDDDQAIYGWRGATLDNLARCRATIRRSRSSSSSRTTARRVRILRSANALIAQQPEALRQAAVERARPRRHDPRRRRPPTTRPKPSWSSQRISAHKFEQRAKYSDYAILYRGNHQARVFETALRAQSIPYDISGGQSLFERTEIKDIVAYLRLIANDDDDPAFLRAVDARRSAASGQTTLAQASPTSRRAQESLFAAAFAPELAARCPRGSARRSHAFCTLVNDLRYRAEREPAGRLLDELMRGDRLRGLAAPTRSTSAMRRRARKSVRDFVDWLARKGETDGRNLLELTQTIALITMLEGRDGEGADAVRLSTLHAAKGLEFPHVFLVGLEEGMLPHREAIDAGDVDEERRLMYVGVTRAQQSAASVVVPHAQARGRARRLRAVALHRRARAGGPALRGRAARRRRSGAAKARAASG